MQGAFDTHSEYPQANFHDSISRQYSFHCFPNYRLASCRPTDRYGLVIGVVVRYLTKFSTLLGLATNVSISDEWERI
jgi:hypothetical protein